MKKVKRPEAAGMGGQEEVLRGGGAVEGEIAVEGLNGAVAADEALHGLVVEMV